MPKMFSIRPGVTLKGRKFKGLRGWAGKPFHPPLTDIPVAAYLFAAVFDLVSLFGSGSVAQDFFAAGTYVIVGGLGVSILAALTGFWDWLRSTEPGNQARRTANWHMTVMLAVTGLVILDVVLRLHNYEDGGASGFVTLLSVIAALGVSFGATYGGSLIFDYGFNVETAGDHPVWHESESDVLPGEH